LTPPAPPLNSCIDHRLRVVVLWSLFEQSENEPSVMTSSRRETLETLAGSLLILASVLGCARGTDDSPHQAAPLEAPARVAGATPKIQSGAMVRGSVARAVGGFPAVVRLELVNGTAVSRSDHVAVPPSELPPSYMDQIAIAFYPPTLLTPVGAPVLFSNGENLMHNVTVIRDESQTMVFNVVTPPGFEPYRHSFVEPGVYRVACNIHPGMSAFIVAVTTPFAAVADVDGGYAIADVPPGSYRAVVWSVDPTLRVDRSVEVPSGQAIVELDLVAGRSAQ
jgi:plastocyanin